jgi:hypothetical protein
MPSVQQDRSDGYTGSNVSRWLYADDLADFLKRPTEHVLGELSKAARDDIVLEQRNAWRVQIDLLQHELRKVPGRGRIYFEYVIPRLGKRVDCVLLINHVLFVVEFKVGEDQFTTAAIEQVWDYALDLKNFHETSHDVLMAPVLIATEADAPVEAPASTVHDDRLLRPVRAGADQIADTLLSVLRNCQGNLLDANAWERGRYRPTPTIIEAARALYAGHSVTDIARSDAGAQNLARTSRAICDIIAETKALRRKSVCFVTGVPGAGKTLVGLDIANRHMSPQSALHSVYLSGNGPLVAVLREALANDSVQRMARKGTRRTKKDAVREVSAFIQNVHHFRDDCLTDSGAPEHVVLFDEAQRAWNLEQTSQFMRSRRGLPDFNRSEPAFLVSCMDRHQDWAVVVCLVGGGQEINKGETGIREWFEAILQQFPDWHVHMSPTLRGSEYGVDDLLAALRQRTNVRTNDQLHLATSMRSFRAERLSEFVRLVLESDVESAAELYTSLAPNYPMVLTRDINLARAWLRRQARGSERFGIVASSRALRLKPHAIDVRTSVNPVHWFLYDRTDTRSSCFLEDAATEFQVQGLELDWTCVVWDGDLRPAADGWAHHQFVGDRWKRILKPDRRRYLENAYRVLLTRARQGMVIAVPHGDPNDPTRDPKIYDPTFEFLKSLNMPLLEA